jgi:hypothetical protein
VYQASRSGAIQAMPSLVITAPVSGTTFNWTMGASLHSALSADTNKIAEWVDGLRRPSPASLTPNAAAEGQPLELRVFKALAAAKILTSHVAMHLEREYHERLFRQLDSLHDTAEWEDGEEPINQSSFQTFLKAILKIKPERRPGLGLSQTGNLIAAWTTERDRLTIEFLPNDRVSWVLARYRDDSEEPARFAGQTRVSELIEGLAPHRPEHWFSHAGKNHEPPE